MIYDMMAGAIVMASILIALFFVRFWRDSGDRFFLYFALSFLIQGVHRAVITFSAATHEDAPLHYVVRLLAYGLILWAILEKNWPRGKQKQKDR
jgi:uncharacterized membrane protein HdeD (DUF308 family)